MLKKAGMVVAASAASLLAVSPLAFAGDYNAESNGASDSKGADSKDKGGDHEGADVIDKDAEGLVAAGNGNNVNVPIQVCNNNVPVNVLGVQAPIEDLGLLNGVTGALGIGGKAKAESGDSTTNQSDNCGQESGSGDSID